MSLVYDILALSSNSNVNCAHITGLNNLAFLVSPSFSSFLPSLLPFFFLVLNICTQSELYTQKN